LSFVYFLQTAPEARLVTTTIDPPENTIFDFVASDSPPALSPDGRLIVFRARAANGTSQLWVRPLDSSTAQPLAGPGNAQSPFWSPDSRSVAFCVEGKLKRLDVTGGPELTLADANCLAGGSWSPKGVIVFVRRGVRPLQRVPARGGAPTVVTTFVTGPN